MPRKYVPKTKKNRRYSRRSHRKRNVLSFSKAPIPNKFATKLRYVESQREIGTGAGGIAGVHMFTCNGLYDPDITGTGHQPRGFDQFMSMYDHYTVIGAKIVVDYCQKPTHTNAGNFILGIACKDSPTPHTDPNDYYEARNVVTKYMPGQGSTTTPAVPLRLSKTCSIKKFLGRSKVLADPELKGNSASNPTEQAYFHIFIGSGDNADETNISINVRIEYLVVFTEPKQPTQS